LDERPHRPTADRWWGESWTFAFATTGGDRGELGGFVRLGLLPNQGTCWYWAWVVGPGRPPVAVVDDEVPLPRSPSLELRSTGLWADHIVEEPFEHVSVGAEAFALELDDPEEAYGIPLGIPTPFGLDLGWETEGPRAPITGPDGIEGYSLPCRVVGVVLVGDERIELDGFGHRQHAWGVEDWWSAGWTVADGRLDDGTWFSGPLDGPDDLDLDLAVEPLVVAPVRITGDGGRTSRLERALCRFRDGPTGRSGIGWTTTNRPA
jgi:hypothetical protein